MVFSRVTKLVADGATRVEVFADVVSKLGHARVANSNRLGTHVANCFEQGQVWVVDWHQFLESFAHLVVSLHGIVVKESENL